MISNKIHVIPGQIMMLAMQKRVVRMDLGWTYVQVMRDMAENALEKCVAPSTK